METTMTTQQVAEVTAHFTRDELVAFLASTLANEARLRKELDESRGIIR